MKNKDLRQSFPTDVTSPGPAQLLSPGPESDPYDLPDEVVTGITYGELRRLHALADPKTRWHEREEQAKSAGRIVGVTFTSAEGFAAGVGDTPKRLINCTLADLDLYSFDLSYYIFDACNLSRARLGLCHNAHFYSCNLRKAVLIGADFRWAKAINCRVDGADFLGIQTTMDCDLWSGLKSELQGDVQLLLYWLTLPDNPLTHEIAEKYIPERVRSMLDATFRREL